MDGLFDLFNDFMHNYFSHNWFEDVHQHFGDELTDEMIVRSVMETSDFFNMNTPMDIHESWITGVMTGMPFTENDDILVFNRQQLYDMGIDDKQSLDLLMTHEGTHRALQGLNTDFTSHQEELCCDYMAGVRAGLNGVDEGKMVASLSALPETSTHPDGALRVKALEAGVRFAEEFRAEHNGAAPTFTDCLENFQNNGIKGFTQADVDWYEHQARISSGSEQAHWLKEAQWARDHIHSFAGDVASEPQNQDVHAFMHGGHFGNATGDYIDDSYPTEGLDGSHHGRFHGLFVDNRAYHEREAQTAKENAEWHTKQANEAIARGDLSSAKDHHSRAQSYDTARKDHLDSASRCTK